jgi:ferritin-like metal-binding protein YciE
MSHHEGSVKERNETLQQYVGDMISVEKHINQAVERQLEEKHLQDHTAEARRIIQEIQQHTKAHAKHLETHLESLGGDASSPIKEGISAILGAAAGMYDKLRTEEVSKMLRDNYTALNLACISYTMLHTTGLALNDQKTADLALNHLKHYTQIVMNINETMPKLVIEELQHDKLPVNQAMTQKAVDNTQKAWQPSSGGNSQGSSKMGNGQRM